MKHPFLSGFLLCWVVSTAAVAQERSFNVQLGLPYAIELGKSASGLKPKLGFVLGVDYWAKNKKGDYWSVGLSYLLYKQKGRNAQNDEQEATFEFASVRGVPIVWVLDKKERWFAEAGGFVNYLLHQDTDVRGAVTVGTSTFRRVHVGVTAGLGLRLGDPGSKALLVGLRNDFWAAGFLGGSKTLKFNAISLFAGLGI